MFESEVYQGYEKLAEHLPADVINQFRETNKYILYQSVLHWSEHCTECAIPECYRTCDLYSPRVDGKCQRFVYGIQRIADAPFDPHFVLRIQFKKWGILQTQGNASVYPTNEVKAREEKDLRRTNMIKYVRPKVVKKYLVKYVYRTKKLNRIKEQNTSKAIPDAFMFECYNPNDKEIKINLTLRSQDEKYMKMPFQYKLELGPGYHRHLIPFDEIEKRLNMDLPFRIDILPYNIEPEEPLYFGRLDFVKVTEDLVKKRKPKGKIKCIVWDLDHTLWDGVLVESKLEDLKLKEGIKDIIVELDKKGILHSVASKNDLDNGMRAIEHFGLAEYFLYPEISWGPKSHGIKRIANNLNINTNTFLFVDDNPFELEEVKTSLPEVLCLDSANYKDIPSMKEFNITVTEESKARRKLYLTELKRKNIEASFDEDYFDFLKSCELVIELNPLVEQHHNRVYELAQRTNQMNFSGNKYTKEQLVSIENDANLDKYVIRSQDKFGEYGIVGFGIVDITENKMVDLMFSCRIQSKRVEHALFTYLLKKYLPNGDFKVNYRKTERNKFTGQVFEDFKFEKLGQEQNILHMGFTQGREIPDDQIIKVIDNL